MIIVAENARGTKEATYQTDTTDDHFIRGKGVKDMNGALDALHEGGIVSWRGTQRLGLLLKDTEDGLDRLAGYELVEDLMLEQFCPCSVLEFIQSGFEERSQFWRGMSRHVDEGTCLVVEDRWEDCKRCNTADNRPDITGTRRKPCHRIRMIDAQPMSTTITRPANGRGDEAVG